MPVTARLSSRFYERLGDEATNELVDWFNTMDADFTSHLQELNELSNARFSAEIQVRFAEQDTRIAQRFAEQDARIARGFAEQDIRIAKGFAEQDARIAKGFADQEAKFTHQITALDTKITGELASLRTDIGRVESRLAWQMFGTLVTVVTVLVSIGTQLLRH